MSQILLQIFPNQIIGSIDIQQQSAKVKKFTLEVEIHQQAVITDEVFESITKCLKVLIQPEKKTVDIRITQKTDMTEVMRKFAKFSA